MFQLESETAVNSQVWNRTPNLDMHDAHPIENLCLLLLGKCKLQCNTHHLAHKHFVVLWFRKRPLQASLQANGKKNRRNTSEIAYALINYSLFRNDAIIIFYIMLFIHSHAFQLTSIYVKDQMETETIKDIQYSLGTFKSQLARAEKCLNSHIPKWKAV